MLNERLLSLIKTAMLTKNQAEVRTLRLIKTEFTKYETSPGAKELDMTTEYSILKRMLREREDSVLQYQAAGREDLAKSEQDEIKVILRFLPDDVSREELEEYITSIIDDTSIKNMGKYVNEVKAKYPMAEGKVIADIVKSKLH